MEVIKDFFTPQHHVIETKRVSLQSDRILSFSRP
nr:MAG TPA: hypothetical protein [Caudoviricetes sp.]